MPELARNSKVLLALTAAAIAAAMGVGIVQSLRVEDRLPMMDLLGAGPETYIDLLLARHDYDAAIEQLQMQTRLLPFVSTAFEQLGNVLSQQNRPEEARAAYEGLLRLRPDSAEAWYYLGNLDLNTGQPRTAAQSLREAIRRNPDFPAALNALGVALVHQGKLAEAEASFARAVELQPDYAEARNNLETARRQLQSTPGTP